MEITLDKTPHHESWNKGKLIGQKAPLKLKEALIKWLHRNILLKPKSS